MKHKTAFRLAIKAIGVLILAQAMPYIFVWIGEFALASLQFGALAPSYLSSYMWTNFFHGVIMCIAGAYLFFGGGWIVDRAIPSNRPYCPECGYELTHASRGGICPECGTPLSSSLKSAAGVRNKPGDANVG